MRALRVAQERCGLRVPPPKPSAPAGPLSPAACAVAHSVAGFSSMLSYEAVQRVLTSRLSRLPSYPLGLRTLVAPILSAPVLSPLTSPPHHHHPQAANAADAHPGAGQPGLRGPVVRRGRRAAAGDRPRVAVRAVAGAGGCSGQDG